MTPERLFVERCQQAIVLLESHSEIELMDLAAILRQLLADQHCLVDTVNKNGIKLEFQVGELLIPEISTPPTLFSLEDGIDPQTAVPGRTPVTLRSTGDFLNHPIMLAYGQLVTIKDVIKFATNVAGGIHHDPAPRSEYQLMHALSQHFGIGGLPLGIRMLKAIGRVTMRTLEPLIEDARKRA